MLRFAVALGSPPPPPPPLLLPAPAPLPRPVPSAHAAASTTTSSPRSSPTSDAGSPHAEGAGAVVLSLLWLLLTGVSASPNGVATCSVARSVARSDVAASPSLARHGSLGSAAEPGSAAGDPGAEFVSAVAEARRFGAAARALARSSQEMLRRLARRLREREALDAAGSESA